MCISTGAATDPAQESDQAPSTISAVYTVPEARPMASCPLEGNIETHLAFF